LGLGGKASTYASLIAKFVHNYTGDEETPRAFAGRDRELAALNAWLADASAEPNLLLTAPAGRGKSMLLVQWLARLDATDLDLVFVPISLRYETSSPAVYLEALAARLAELIGETLTPPLANAVGYFKDRVLAFLSTLPRTGRRCLMVIDGLDEAAAYDVDQTLLPSHPPAGLRIVLSAREIALLDAAGWRDRIGWTRDRARVRSMSVPRFDFVNIAAILDANRVPLDTASRNELVDALLRLTAGDPLLVQLYAEDLAKQTGDANTVAALRAMKPGYGAYFDDWFRRQERAWKEAGIAPDERWKAVLAVLANAYGPIFQEDLEHLVDRVLERRSIVDNDVIGLVQRFVLNNGLSAGFVLGHPRLADFLKNEFLVRGRWSERGSQAFLDWGQSVLDDLSGEASGLAAKTSLKRTRRSDRVLIPEYLSQFYSQHLLDAEDDAAILRLAECSAWAAAQMTIDNGGTRYLTDLERARDAVERLNRADVERGSKPSLIGAELRVGLSIASVHSLTANVPPALAAVLVTNGIWSPQGAIASARQLADPIDRCETLRRLSSVIPSERTALLRAAVDAWRTIDESAWQRNDLLSRLVPELPPELVTVVVDNARHLDNAEQRTAALSLLCAYVPEARRTSVIADALKPTEDAETLVNVVEHLADSLRGEVLPRALTAVRSLPNGDEGRARHLASLVGYIAAGSARETLLDEALDAALAVEIVPLSTEPHWWQQQPRTRALVELAPHLSGGRLTRALAAAMELAHVKDRSEALRVLAPRLAQERRVSEAFDAIAGTRIESARPNPWTQVVPQLQTVEDLEAAFRHIEPMENPVQRAKALSVLAGRFAQLGARDRGLKIAKSVDNDWFRLDALCRVALAYPPPAPQTIVQTVLDASRSPYAQRDLADRTENIDEEPFMQLALRCADAGAINEALTLARAWPKAGSDGRAGSLVYALTSVATHLEPSERGATLREAWSAAQLIGDARERVAALTQLVVHVPAAESAQFVEAFHSALDSIRTMSDEERQADLLNKLGPHLPAPLLDEARDIVSKFRREDLRAGTLAELASSAPWDEPRQRVAFAAARERPDTLAELAPRLAEALQREALEIARGLSRAQPRTQLLAALAPLLTADLQRDVLDDVKEIANGFTQGDILVKVFPYLDESLLDLAITRVNEFQDASPWTEAVAALIPRMAAFGRHQDALEAAALIDWERSSMNDDAPSPRATALIGISRHLTPDERVSLFSRAVADAMQISDHLARSLTLAQLATELSDPLTELKGQVLRAALDAARSTKDSDEQSRAIAVLGPKLHEPLLGEALTIAALLPEGGYLNRSLRAAALEGLAIRLSELPPAKLYERWSVAFRALAKWTRPGLLWDIPALAPLLASLGGPHAAADAGRVIFDVAQSWP
jgi:hypothetical protein